MIFVRSGDYICLKSRLYLSEAEMIFVSCPVRAVRPQVFGTQTVSGRQLLLLYCVSLVEDEWDDCGKMSFSM